MSPVTLTMKRSVDTLVEEARRTLGELARELRGFRRYAVALGIVMLVGGVDLWLRTECRRLAAQIHAQEARAEELRELYRELTLDHSVRRGVEHLEQAARELGLEAPGEATQRPGGGTPR